MIGKAQNQFVSPGYGIFHMGIAQDVKELEKPEGTSESKEEVQKKAEATE